MKALILTLLLSVVFVLLLFHEIREEKKWNHTEVIKKIEQQNNFVLNNRT